MHSEGPKAWFSDGKEERESILKMGEPWKDKTVLEIGCGEGDLVIEIGKINNGRIMGVDFSETAIEKAKEKHRVEKDHFTVWDLKTHDYPFADIFDRIVIQGVLEHLDDPLVELKWMMDNLLTDYGDVITSSPGFINPRGIVWMALDMVGAVMSKTDLHFLNPWDFENFCQIHGYKLQMATCDLDWGCGDRMIEDIKQRIPLALKDGNLKAKDLFKFLDWLEWAAGRMPIASYGGATIVYRIRKGD